MRSVLRPRPAAAGATRALVPALLALAVLGGTLAPAAGAADSATVTGSGAAFTADDSAPDSATATPGGAGTATGTRAAGRLGGGGGGEAHTIDYDHYSLMVDGDRGGVDAGNVRSPGYREVMSR